MPFVLSETVRPPSPAARQYFGGTYAGAVSFDGDTLAVGAWGGSGGAGAAYVYQRSSRAAAAAMWTPVAVLGPDTTGSEYFGLSLSLSGARLAVGAPNANPSGAGSYSGAVYVFEQSTDANATAWARKMVLTPPCVPWRASHRVSLPLAAASAASNSPAADFDGATLTARPPARAPAHCALCAHYCAAHYCAHYCADFSPPPLFSPCVAGRRPRTTCLVGTWR